nr:MAG TPA: hypothetical protein [Caudoviricetes sp.]
MIKRYLNAFTQMFGVFCHFSPIFYRLNVKNGLWLFVWLFV